MPWISLSLLSAFFKSLSTISEKEILFKERISDYTSGMSFIIALLSLPLLFFVKNMNFNMEIFWLIFALSIISIIDSFTLIYVLKKMDIGESSVLFATTPVIVAIMGSVFLGEFLTTFQTVGIIVSSLGLFILEFPEKEKHLKEISIEPVKHSRKMIYFILTIGLIMFGIGTISDRYVIHYLGVDPLLFLVIIQLCISLNMFAYDVIKNVFSKESTPRQRLLDPSLLIKKAFWANVLFLIVSRTTYLLTMNLVAASLSNAVRQSSSLITTVVGGKLFKEKAVVRRSLAGLVVVVGVLLVVV